MTAFVHDLWVKIRTNIVNAVALLGTLFGSILSHLDSIFQMFLANIDALAATLGDPNLTQQLSSVVSDAKWIGRWLLTVGIIATVAKFKKLVQSPKP